MYILIIHVVFLFCLKAAALNYMLEGLHIQLFLNVSKKILFEPYPIGDFLSHSRWDLFPPPTTCTYSPRNKAPQPKTTAHGSWFHLLNLRGFGASLTSHHRGSTPLCRSPSVCLRVAKPMQLLGLLMVRFSSPHDQQDR